MYAVNDAASPEARIGNIYDTNEVFQDARVNSLALSYDQRHHSIAINSTFTGPSNQVIKFYFRIRFLVSNTTIFITRYLVNKKTI